MKTTATNVAPLRTPRRSLRLASLLAPLVAPLVALTLLPAAPLHAQLPDNLPRRTADWPERTLSFAESLPVQDGGRIKPLSTYASFTLLRFNGMSSIELPDDSKLEALPWLLDTLFYPEQADTLAMFNVPDISAVQAIHLDLADKRKHDRYSFDELRPHVDELFDQARAAARKEDKKRDLVEQQILTLATSVDDYLRLRSHFDYARFSQDVGDSPELVKLFGGDEARFSQVVAKLPELIALLSSWRGDPARAQDGATLSRVLQMAAQITDGTGSLALIPPTGMAAVEPDWHSPEDLFTLAMQGTPLSPTYIEELQLFETLSRAVGEPAAFEQALGALNERNVALATARGEYEQIGLEVTYYKWDLIANSLVVYILGFVLSALLWMAPRNKLLYRGAALAAAVATGLLVTAIVIRCVIRGRPPVSTLYETMLFVTAVGSILLLVTEWIGRQRIALSVNTALGMIGLFLANGYETLDKQDTMPQLVAVLDTNFWLATHVTAITVGYAAGMVAAMIASLYLITRLFGIRRSQPAFGKGLLRMTYGTLCFGLIFSVVGTILGGIWANDSWGRFWGWDPKENGAMLICLAEIIILHGRMGGFLRDFGTAAATAFLGTVIAFSWFGVNLLGVGLHSYGFTSGIHTALWTYYLLQWGLIAVCWTHYALQRSREKAAKAAAQAQAGGVGDGDGKRGRPARANSR